MDCSAFVYDNDIFVDNLTLINAKREILLLGGVNNKYSHASQLDSRLLVKAEKCGNMIISILHKVH